MTREACCFTGHRVLSRGQLALVHERLEETVDTLVAQGITEFIAGGALGFDMLASFTILLRKAKGLPLRLTLALPFPNHDQHWKAEDRYSLQYLLKEADAVNYISDAYSPACMRLRNQYMVDHSRVCVCAMLRQKSGTGQTTRYAQKQGCQVIYLLKNE